MNLNQAAPWHRESWNRFVLDLFPGLLKERVPLVGYRTEETGSYTFRLELIIQGGDGEFQLNYDGLPRPDEAGLFKIEDGCYRVVVPTASSPELEDAEIRCVGEQLRDFIAGRLGDAPASLHWDADLARKWLAIDDWFTEFHLEHPHTYNSGTSQSLRTTNWLDAYTHLRRITLAHIGREPEPPYRLTGIPVNARSQQGRVCPFCLPEGPNIGLIFEVARGASIRDGRVVIDDDSPLGALGLAASSIPFLEHSDSNRILMGVNMVRQWVGKPGEALPLQTHGPFGDYHKTMRAAEGLEREPALVQTGLEPDTPDFWCGRNLLTAFISWDGDGFEDGIVVSESCAARMRTPEPLEPGDKLSHRHGHKGVVSRVLPDDQMPALPDGTPIELIYSVCGLPSRMAHGAVMEAVAGRIAAATGETQIVPPFESPSMDELRQRLRGAGLPEDGMETLTVNGRQLDRRSTVGWVYWGALSHLVREKIHSATAPRTRNGQVFGEQEYEVLAHIGAFETVREQSHTCAVASRGSDTLADRVASGDITHLEPPRAGFVHVLEGLAAGGVGAELKDGRVVFALEEPKGDVLKLAKPVSHPWLPGTSVDALGVAGGLTEYDLLVAANNRLSRMLDGQTPEALAEKAVEHLTARVVDYLDALVHPALLRFQERVLFSGRTVITPGPELTFEELGVADDIAWALFGPLAIRVLGDAKAVEERSAEAARVLDRAMAERWIILYRGIARGPTCMVAFRPRRVPGNALRVHPLACELMNADFDGDQAAVYLPLTDAGQREAGELLSLEGHLKRDSGLIRALHPKMDALVGLANLSRTEEGLAEIEALAGTGVAAPRGFVTRQTVTDALARVLEKDGPHAALATSERLMRRGFDAARTLGLSLSPFLGARLDLPPEPEGDDPDEWQIYSMEVGAALAASADVDSDDWGAANLLMQSGARGSVPQLKQYVGGTGVVLDVEMKPVVVARGWSEGLTPEEIFARVPGARRGLAGVVQEIEAFEKGQKAEFRGYGVLARARNAARPGMVFARAAANGETDPLEDAWSRLFVGLGVEKQDRRG